MVKLHTADPMPAEEALRKQTKLFQELSGLNEERLPAGDLLEKAAKITCDNWIVDDTTAVQIKRDSNTFSCGNTDDFDDFISVETELADDSLLGLEVYSEEERSFTANEKNLCLVILDMLSTKINRSIAQQKLDIEQERLDRAYKLAHIGTWHYDIGNDKLIWSDVTKQVHGFGPEYTPDVESTIMLFKEGYHRDTFARAAEDAIERGIPFDLELKIISGKGDERWIRATGEPEYEDGECVRFYGISQNVTDRRKAEEDLEFSERRFRALVKYGMDMLSILDEEGSFIYVSEGSEQVLGFDSGYFDGKNAFSFIHEGDVKRTRKEFNELPSGESIAVKPFRFPDINGNWRWLETTVSNLSNDPAVRGYVCNSRDITDRMIKQEELLEAIKQKDTILGEIHHRIKNNLSVLTGTLHLQVAEENNEEVMKRLLDSIARIHTIASIHEHLYVHNNYTSIDFSDRLTLLTKDIRQTMQTEAEVDLDFQLIPVEIPVEQATNCFLLINEVLTNIFKHAFTGRKKGQITISLTRPDKDHDLCLSIRDNGKGFSPEQPVSKSGTLGMSLIDMLSRQIGADYSFASDDKGTTFELYFDT